VREKTSSDTNNWSDGPLTGKNLIAMNDANVGLQACWYSSGMHLWYASDAYTVNEYLYLWTDPANEWNSQSTFTANGHAGIGCYSWGPGTVNYAMMVNLNNDINILWKDMNNTAQQTWKNVSSPIPGPFLPNTSLGYTDYFFAQVGNGSLAGYNVNFDTDNTMVNSQFTIPERPLAGTHFSVAQPNTENGVIVFDQITGSDIVQNTFNNATGQWPLGTDILPDD
jgi:hypothetical protein